MMTSSGGSTMPDAENVTIAVGLTTSASQCGSSVELSAGSDGAIRVNTGKSAKV